MNGLMDGCMGGGGGGMGNWIDECIRAVGVWIEVDG